MVTLHDRIAAHIEAKDEKAKTTRVKVDFGTELQGLLDSHTFGFLGPTSFYVPKGRIKFVDESVYPFGPAEKARAYLELIGAKRAARWLPPSQMITAPPKAFYPERQTKGTWAYVDLKAAYWQLYHASTFDLSYGEGFAGRRLYRGNVEFQWCDEWKADKLARNCIWGTIIADQMRVWSDGEIKVRNVRGRFAAPHLALWIQHQLHAVFRDVMSRSSSPMWNDDGFLVPLEEAETWRAFLRERWGLASEVKEVGEGNVWGCGNYEWRESGRKAPARRVDTGAELDGDQIETVRVLRLKALEVHNCGA